MYRPVCIYIIIIIYIIYVCVCKYTHTYVSKSMKQFMKHPLQMWHISGTDSSFFTNQAACFMEKPLQIKDSVIYKIRSGA